MADQPKKVGVYDSGGPSSAGTTTAGTTTARAGSDSKVEVQRDATKSGTPWWAIALVILAIIVAIVIFT